jgi:hypothetical protein
MSLAPPLPWVADDVVVPWSALPAEIRDAPISIAWIGSDGKFWPLTGLDAGAEGAFVSGDIDGLVHVPFEGIWTKPADGPPTYERQVDARKEVSFQLGLFSDTALGWYDTETRWWAGCKSDDTGYLSVTTLRHGQMWLPMQLLEAPKCALPDDPSYSKCAVHNVVLAVSGEPRFRRPDVMPPPWKRPAGSVDRGILTVANYSFRPQWPIYFLEASPSAKSKIMLPDGPNAMVANSYNPLSDWGQFASIFGIPIISDLLQQFTATREVNMIQIPDLEPNEHAIIDTDPAHRIAVTILDPVDNSVKRFIRNSELFEWLTGNYGESGLPLIQRFKGQGFSIPLPPRSVCTLPILHNIAGRRIAVQLPQTFDSALH